MSKALKTVGVIVAGVALVATGVGALAGAGLLGASASALAASAGAWTLAGVSVSTLTQVGAGLAFLGDVTAKQLKVGGTAGTQVDFAADPNAPIPYLIGRSGTGGRIVYATTGEAKNRNMLYCNVLSGGGPIEAFESFKAGDESVVFGELQQAVGGPYANRMWQNNQLGLTPSPAFGPPNTTDAAVLAEWTANHRLSGLAASWYVLGYDQKTYSSGVPKALWVLKGARVYDPRLDDTYPGGIGAQRINDPSTWEWSENGPLHGLTWCLGRYENGVRVLGIGARAESIVIAAFVEAANVADANGWKVGGVVYSTDSKWDVLKAMCQAGGARPLQLAAQITCLVNAPRTSLATLTEADIVGGYSVQAVSSMRNRPNQIIPRYRSEAHGWEVVAAGPVKVADYVARDGRLRSREVVYPLVQDAGQVAQLAAYDLVNAREFGPVQVPCKPQWMGYRPGDCITVDAPTSLGLAGQKCLILARTIDPMTGEVTLTLQSETDGKHDFALGRTASPPPVPGLTGVDPLPAAPSGGSWAAVGTALAAGDGSQVPAIVVTGASDDPNASNIIVEYRLATGGDFASEEFPVSRGRAEIRGLASVTAYQVRIRYRTVRGLENEEVFLDLGVVVTGKLIAGDTMSFGGVAAVAIEQAIEQIRQAQLQLLRYSAQAQTLFDDKLAQILAVADGRPLGAVLVEHKQTFVDNKLAIGSNSAAITLETANRITAVSAEAALRAALATDYAGFKASATSTLSGLSTAQGSTAAAVTSLTTDYNGFKSTAQSTLLSHTSSIESLSGSVTSLSSTVASNKASADASLLTLSNADSAFSTQLTSLTTTVGNNKASADSSISTLTTQQSSTAGSLSTLASDYSGFKSSANSSIVTLSNAQGTQAGQISTLQSTASGLSATVSSQALTLADVANKVAAARFVLEASASGGRPARMSLYSDSFGASNVALSAAKIYFGDNTVFDDASDTLRTDLGSAAYIIAWGAAFGADGDLLLWLGPPGIGYWAASRANAYFYLAKSTPYLGGSAVPTGGGGGGGFSLNLSTPLVTAHRFGVGPATTDAVTVTASGASGGVAYSWAYVSGSAFTISSAGASTVDFTGNISALGQTLDGFWRVTGRDSAGHVAFADVRVIVQENS